MGPKTLFFVLLVATTVSTFDAVAQSPPETPTHLCVGMFFFRGIAFDEATPFRWNETGTNLLKNSVVVSDEQLPGIIKKWIVDLEDNCSSSHPSYSDKKNQIVEMMNACSADSVSETIRDAAKKAYGDLTRAGSVSCIAGVSTPANANLSVPAVETHPASRQP